MYIAFFHVHLHVIKAYPNVIEPANSSAGTFPGRLISCGPPEENLKIRENP